MPNFSRNGKYAYVKVYARYARLSESDHDIVGTVRRPADFWISLEIGFHEIYPRRAYNGRLQIVSREIRARENARRSR